MDLQRRWIATANFAILEFSLFSSSKNWIEAAKELNAGCREDEKDTNQDKQLTKNSQES